MRRSRHDFASTPAQLPQISGEMAISSRPKFAGQRVARDILPDVVGKTHAIAKEIAIILQPAWNQPIASGVSAPGEQRHGLMANFERRPA